MANILDEAKEITEGARKHDYGSAYENHNRTAGMFTAYLKAKYGVTFALDADDVCWLNILQKCARDTHRSKRDNWVDTAGYARNIEMIHHERDPKTITGADRPGMEAGRVELRPLEELEKSITNRSDAYGDIPPGI